jgi:hypothetical protein
MSRVTDVLSIDVTTPGHLSTATIGGGAFRGYEVQTADGKPATLAVIDESGHIVESGPQVAEEAWVVAVLAYQRFLEGEGRLRVVSAPGALQKEGDAQ